MLFHWQTHFLSHHFFKCCLFFICVPSTKHYRLYDASNPCIDVPFYRDIFSVRYSLIYKRHTLLSKSIPAFLWFSNNSILYSTPFRWIVRKTTNKRTNAWVEQTALAALYSKNPSFISQAIKPYCDSNIPLKCQCNRNRCR